MGVQQERYFLLSWRKSRYSADQGNCVEIASLPCSIFVRDSRAASGPVLVMAPDQWVKFIQHVRNG